MTIVLFIAVLLVCVLVHEWGHFITAKKSGMLVEEFGFGIPPKLWSWKKGETEYSVNALPIGGFVRIAGENGSTETVPYNRQFESKPWYLKSLVLIAGVIGNFLLAVLLFTVSYSIGTPGVTPQGIPTVVSVVPGSPIAIAGIYSGDHILSVAIDGTPVSSIDTQTLHLAVQKTKKTVDITYIHNDVERVVSVAPTTSSTGLMLGVGIEPIGVIQESLPKAFIHAWKHSVDLISQIIKSIGELLGGLFTGNASTEGLVGPVGLAREVGVAATFGFSYVLAFTAMISLNLAVLNILPFPALDGGRLVVVLFEAITRKKLSSKTVGIIHTIGFLILIGLMIALTIGDIKKAL